MASPARFGFPELAKPFTHAITSPVAVSAARPELISDDPRRAPSFADDLAELQTYFDLTREHGELLTSSQAALILGVTTGQIATWRARGRITSFLVLGVPMVPASEVAALYRERAASISHRGGRGVKAPSLAALVRAGYRDTQE